MAYTTPRTWVQNAILTAAQLNSDVRDNMVAVAENPLRGVATPSPAATQKYNIQVTSGGAVSLVESPFELFVRRLSTGTSFLR